MPFRFATPRDESAPTVGAQVARMADVLGGWRLSRWQRQVADVAGELAADGRYRYRTVVLIVPRRAGKTRLMLPTLMHRAAQRPGRRCWYTAQDRASAARLFREEWVPLVEPLAPWLRIRHSQGSETVTLPTRGSSVALFAPGPKAIHSADADTVVIDEAWAFDELRGRALEQGIRPAMTAVSRLPQLWIVSAGLDAGSSWLAPMVEQGRAGNPSWAYFEASADPDVDDIDDPAVLDRVHLGVEDGIVDRAAVLDDRESMVPAEWARAYLCVRTGQVTAPPAYPANLVAAAVVETGPPATARPVFAVEVALDRSAAAVVAAIPTAAGVHLELVTVVAAHAAARTAAQLARTQRARLCGIAYGPTGPIIDELTRTGAPVDRLGWADAARAAAALADGFTAGTVQLLNATPLVDGLRGARRKQRGESWVICGGDVGDAIATAAAVAHDAARVAGIKPAIRTA